MFFFSLNATFLVHEYKIFLCYLVERQCDKFFSYPLKICGHTMKPFRYYFDQLKSPSKDREKQKFTYISVQASLSLIILLYISCKSIEFNPLWTLYYMSFVSCNILTEWCISCKLGWHKNFQWMVVKIFFCWTIFVSSLWSWTSLTVTFLFIFIPFDPLEDNLISLLFKYQNLSMELSEL